MEIFFIWIIFKIVAFVVFLKEFMENSKKVKIIVNPKQMEAKWRNGWDSVRFDQVIKAFRNQEILVKSNLPRVSFQCLQKRKNIHKNTLVFRLLPQSESESFKSIKYCLCYECFKPELFSGSPSMNFLNMFCENVCWKFAFAGCWFK